MLGFVLRRLVSMVFVLFSLSILVFVIFIAILAVRPTGLFGKKIVEKV